MLEVSNLSRRVNGAMHLYPTSVSFEAGKFNVLLGSAHAGKTTLIKLLAGITRPTSGDIFLDGTNVTNVRTQKRNISLVHEFFVNYPHLSVFDNIASPLRAARYAAKDIDTRVRQTAEILKLETMLFRRPHELSGGQQQRIALARAIVKESRVVFLDEPLANLDYKLREELRDCLPDWFAGRGTIVVYATSEPGDALRMGGTTSLLHEGRIVQSGPTEATYHNPISLKAACVFSDPPVNTAMVTKRDGMIFFGEHHKWAAAGPAAHLDNGSYQIGIRPHFVLPYRSSVDCLPITGLVQIVEISGSESIVHFRFGDKDWVSLGQGVHKLSAGSKHTFYLDYKSCFYFDASGDVAICAPGKKVSDHG